MANKYYINESGLATLILSISSAIVSHTSGAITFVDLVDPQTLEVESVLLNPNNFATVEAVANAIQNATPNITPISSAEINSLFEPNI